MKTKKRKRLMTEREAWLFLAGLWDKPERSKSMSHRPGTVAIYIGQWASLGLCDSISDLFQDGVISSKSVNSMEEKIRFELQRSKSRWLYPNTRAGAKKRAALCRKFAKECKR